MQSSTFNIVHQTDNGVTTVLNTVTGALITVDESDTCSSMSKQLASPSIINEADISTYVSELKRGGYIVDSDTDEMDRVKLRELLAQYAEDSIGLTILTTLRCNFRCPYCYEKHSNVDMTKSTAKKLLKYICKQIQYRKKLGIAWYGGEPLLNMNIMQWLGASIRNATDNVGCKYECSITTNGYLLTEDVLDRLIQDVGIKVIMVTLDGPERIHDSRRVREDGGRTYKTILDNVCHLCEAAPRELKIKLRTNVDKGNIDTLEEYISSLPEVVRSRADFSFEAVAMLSDVPDSYSPKMFKGASRGEQVETIIEMYDKCFSPRLSKNAITVFSPILHLGAHCGAETTSFAVIGPRGELYKCSAQVDRGDEIGSIEASGETKINYSRLAEWTEWGELYSVNGECTFCKIRPLCHGGCKARRKTKDAYCSCLKWSKEKYINYVVKKILQ